MDWSSETTFSVEEGFEMERSTAIEGERKAKCEGVHALRARIRRSQVKNDVYQSHEHNNCDVFYFNVERFVFVGEK